MPSLLDAALGYATRQGWAIFPVNGVTAGKCDCGRACDSPGKHPLTPNGFKDATRDPATVREWWTRWPNANIAVPLGKGVGVVWDVDPRNGGNESFKRLYEPHARDEPIPEGPRVETGGGGWHYWFAHPGGNFPPAHGFLPGLDMQSDGSYVLLPPSNHASGRRYEWIMPADVELPMMPNWLFRAATERPAGSARRVPVAPTGAIPHGRHHDWIRDTAASLASRVAGISEDALLRQVRGACREALDDFDKHEREIAESVRSAIAKYGHPAGPDPDDEAEAAIDMAIVTGKPPPSSTPADPGAPGPVHTPEAGSAGTPLGPSAPAVTGVETSHPPAPDPIPDGLFNLNEKTGEQKGDRAQFVDWFRETESFAVPIEHATFMRGAPEILRYEAGYYNGEAAAFINRRVEDAYRTKGLTASKNFVSETIHGVARSTEFHRKRDSFNPARLLCLDNGIFDLDTRLPPTPHPDRPPPGHPIFTWKLPVAYDRDAICPRFDQFLGEVMPDRDRRELLVDLMGYALTRKNRFNLFFVCVGDGGNGKTTFGNVLNALLGKDAVATLTLQQITSNRFAPAQLDGKLVNLCDDLPYNKPLEATGILKVLTGEGTMSAENKGQPLFDLRFGGKLISMGNRLPPTSEDTTAFWRRAVVIPFDETFLEDDPRRDPDLEEKLVAELPGILNRALEGLRRVQSRRKFDPKGLFSNSKEEWRMRADPIRQFVLTTREVGRDLYVPSDDLYRDYVAWTQESEENAVDKKVFGKHLKKIVPSQHKRKRVGGDDVWCYIGVGGPRGVASQNAIPQQQTLDPPPSAPPKTENPVLTSDGGPTVENGATVASVASQTSTAPYSSETTQNGELEPVGSSLATTSDGGRPGAADPAPVDGAPGTSSAASEERAKTLTDSAYGDLLGVLDAQGRGPWDRDQVRSRLMAAHSADAVSGAFSRLLGEGRSYVADDGREHYRPEGYPRRPYSPMGRDD